MIKTTDIFIVTYWKDAEWLDYCLQAIAKHCTGFRQVVIACPNRDKDIISRTIYRCSRRPPALIAYFEEGPNGHAWQNAIKSHADTYTDADFICHVDCDCLFHAQVSPEAMRNEQGNPVIWMGRYDEITHFHPGGVPWREITENAVKKPCEYEFMQVFPLMYHRDTYSGLRSRIEEQHGIPAMTYMLSAPKLGAAFHGYSEFNALGAFAYHFQPEKYEFRDIKGIRRQSPWMKQLWSHAGVEQYMQEIKEILG